MESNFNVLNFIQMFFLHELKNLSNINSRLLAAFVTFTEYLQFLSLFLTVDYFTGTFAAIFHSKLSISITPFSLTMH